MIKRSLLLGCVCFFQAVGFAQSDDPVLMRVNGKEISRSEFEYFYHRYTEGTDHPLSPKEYAGVFAESRLKVEEAKAAGLDTTAAFRNRRETFRAQLLEAYFTDTQAMDSCARLLYRKKEVQPRNGQVLVMQIFKYLPQTISPRHLEAEKSRMDSLYQAICNQPDLDFARLVEQYSDDKHSQWIASLQTTSEFENVAFSLSKGEISTPFFTPEGLHIVKVIDRKELPAYKEISGEVAERFKRRGIEGTVMKAVVERLKNEWNYVPNQPAIAELLQKGTTEQTLFTIDGHEYTGSLFRQFAFSHPQAVRRQLDGFIAKSLIDYENSCLEEKYPSVRSALQAFDADYLIAELTRRKIDLPATNDRAGLATYFKFHQSDYRWESPRYKGVVLHCVDKKTAKRAKKLLKKTPEKEWAQALRQTFNTSGVEKIKIEQGVFVAGENKYVDKLIFKKGGFEPLLSYPFTVSVGEKQKVPEDYREVEEQVRKDYRNYLDACWTRELKDSGKVEINQEVLKTVNNN